MSFVYYQKKFVSLLIRRAINAVTVIPLITQKNAKFSLSIFFDFWRQRVARRQKSEKMPRCHLIDAPIGRIDQMVRRPAVGRKIKHGKRNSILDSQA